MSMYQVFDSKQGRMVDRDFNNLAEMQEFVGGSVEFCHFGKNIGMYLNENGINLKLTPTVVFLRGVGPQIFYGNAIFGKMDKNGNLKKVTDAELNKYVSSFVDPELNNCRFFV